MKFNGLQIYPVTGIPGCPESNIESYKWVFDECTSIRNCVNIAVSVSSYFNKYTFVKLNANCTELFELFIETCELFLLFLISDRLYVRFHVQIIFKSWFKCFQFV